MQLLRIASAYFEPPPKGWDAWTLDLDDVHISTIPIGRAPPVEGKLRLVLQAATEIGFPEINGDGYVLLPKDKRLELEAGLETAANLLAVFGGCRRSLSSASPSVALVPDDDLEREKLESSKGILTDRAATISVLTQIPLEPQLLQGLSDRLDGVALMAEALSHGLESGRFREYVRIFECGFGMAFSEVSRKLSQFLHPTFGYTRAEIDAWVRMRDPLTHADRRYSTEIIFDSDVRKVTQRMKQAAYDILLHKAVWHDRSRSRRALWSPPAATTSASTDLVIHRGSTPTMRFQLFDEFGVFPKDLQCHLSPPPTNWWCKFAGRTSTEDLAVAEATT